MCTTAGTVNALHECFDHGLELLAAVAASVLLAKTENGYEMYLRPFIPSYAADIPESGYLLS